MKPMLARAQPAPPAGDYFYEPKWDGFRCLVFRGGRKISLQSRNEKPLNRYFPELVEGLLRALPERCIVDGEIVIEGPHGLDFDALLQRVHPAASRVARLAAETPASFVAFDLLELGPHKLSKLPFRERRRALEENLHAVPPLRISPITTQLAQAERWFSQFEGSGFDGIVAKDPALPYLENQRVMIKVKHQRTADCVVGGYREGKPGEGLASLLLGLYDDANILQHVGVAAGLPAEERKRLERELRPLTWHVEHHPWLDGELGRQRLPGGPSRWNEHANLAWIAVQPVLVVEVAYDHLQGERFRHTTHVLRMRPDRDARSCTYAQLRESVESGK